MRTLAAAACAALALSAVASAASAAVTELTFTTPGAAQPQVFLNGLVEGTSDVDPNLGATLDLTLSSVTAGGYQWNFSYELSNVSTEVSRLSSLGFDVDPAFSGVAGVSGVLGTAASGNLASLGDREVCLKDGGGTSNCTGGGNGGLWDGQSGSGAFSLTFESSTVTFTYIQVPRYNPKGKLLGYDTIAVPHFETVAAPTSVRLFDFGAHYQALALGGSTVGLSADRPLPPPDNGGQSLAVPEPATWALMIVGFGTAGAMLRRRPTRA